MKKLITLVLALVCVLGLVGCNQKAVSASEVYSFPEPTTMITVSFYSQGEETAFEIGSEEYDSNDLSTTPVINWFYDLKLTACDEPEAVEGSESYEFYVKGESAFTYEDRGSEAYIIVADGLFCREIDGLFCRSSPDIIVRRRCVLSHKRRGWLQPSPSFRYSRNLALQDELYHPVINNGPAVLVCVDKRLGTGPVNQSRDAG